MPCKCSKVKTKLANRLPTKKVGCSIEKTQSKYDGVLSRIVRSEFADFDPTAENLTANAQITEAFNEACVLTDKFVLLSSADPVVGAVPGDTDQVPVGQGARSVGLNLECPTRGGTTNGGTTGPQSSSWILSSFNGFPSDNNVPLGQRFHHRLDKISSYDGGDYVVAEITAFVFAGVDAGTRNDSQATPMAAFQCVFQYVRDTCCPKNYKLDSLIFQVIDVPEEGVGKTYFDGKGDINEPFRHRYKVKCSKC